MPYITKERRIDLIAGQIPKTPGELTYLLTKDVDEYLTDNLNFDGFADAIGALEATKLELYRRLVSPYEDMKLLDNGEVYESNR